jgi:hypothetical protein
MKKNLISLTLAPTPAVITNSMTMATLQSVRPFPRPIFSPSLTRPDLAPSAYYEVIDEVGRLLEGDAASHFGPNISKMKIYPPKPMILFPALPANVRIYFTVSEVFPPPPLPQPSASLGQQILGRGVASCSSDRTMLHPRRQLAHLETSRDDQSGLFFAQLPISLHLPSPSLCLSASLCLSLFPTGPDLSSLR